VATTITSRGLKPGSIKHVWLIIRENKSYDATFTGLKQSTPRGPSPSRATVVLPVTLSAS
jgi:phospholipase C